jgi:hypothetical protein
MGPIYIYINIYIFLLYLYPFMYLLHILKLGFTAFLSSIYLPGDLRWGLYIMYQIL